MSLRSFPVSLEIPSADKSLTLYVYVHASLEELRRADGGAAETLGFFRSTAVDAPGYEANAVIGTLHLTEDALSSEILVHEVAHAVHHVYGVELLGKSSDDLLEAKAWDHFTPDNEPLAYLLSGTFAAVAYELERRGFVIS